jgi:hypothetical protein
MTSLLTVTPIGLDVLIRGDPPPGSAFFSAKTLSLGPVNGNPLFPDPAPRQNIARSPTAWMNPAGCANDPRRATIIYCDNVSAMYLSSNPVQHQRTKHVEIDLHFVRDRVALGEVKVLHVPTTSQYADIFTKGLPMPLFLDFRSSLNIMSPDVQSAGGC